MKITIGLEASKKLKNFVDLTPGEISGLGKSHKTEDGNIFVDDIILLKQTCSGATTDLDDDAMALAGFKMMEDGESLEEWNVWWHSHANMNVFWSTTDDNTIQSHIGIQTHLVSIVTNKKEEFKARLDIFPKDVSGFNIPVFHTTNLEVEVEIDDDIPIMFSDIRKEKQIEISDSLNEKILKDEEPVFNVRPAETLWDAELFDFCMKEVDDKVSIKTYPIVNNYNKLAQHELNLLGDPKKPMSKKQWKKQMRNNNPGFFSIKDINDKKIPPYYDYDAELGGCDDDFLLPSHMRNEAYEDAEKEVNKVDSGFNLKQPWE
jgi:hypothetical protein